LNTEITYYLFTFICYVFLLVTINFFLSRKSLLLYKTYKQSHKRQNLEKNIVLSGGLFFLIILIISNFQIKFQLINFIIYALFFVIIGIFSDLNKGITAKTRLLIMLAITFIILINSQLIIEKIDIQIIDFFLQFNLFSILIFTIAVVTIVNGSNFIDGNNANCSGYFFLVYFLLLFKSDNFNFTDNDIYLIKNMTIGLIVFSIFNLYNRSYLGDNGAYFLGFLTSIISIYLFSKYSISSLLIIAYFSYPVAEISVSIIRKFIEKQDPMSADKRHLHQLIESKILLNQSKLVKNNLSTFFIMILNSIYFVILLNSDLSKVNLIQIISGYFFFYISFYLFLRIFKVSKKKN